MSPLSTTETADALKNWCFFDVAFDDESHSFRPNKLLLQNKHYQYHDPSKNTISFDLTLSIDMNEKDWDTETWHESPQVQQLKTLQESINLLLPQYEQPSEALSKDERTQRQAILKQWSRWQEQLETFENRWGVEPEDTDSFEAFEENPENETIHFKGVIKTIPLGIEPHPQQRTHEDYIQVVSFSKIDWPSWEEATKQGGCDFMGIIAAVLPHLRQEPRHNEDLLIQKVLLDRELFVHLPPLQQALLNSGADEPYDSRFCCLDSDWLDANKPIFLGEKGVMLTTVNRLFSEGQELFEALKNAFSATIENPNSVIQPKKQQRL